MVLYVMEHVSVVLHLSLSWMKANMGVLKVECVVG